GQSGSSRSTSTIWYCRPRIRRRRSWKPNVLGSTGRALGIDDEGGCRRKRFAVPLAQHADGAVDAFCRPQPGLKEHLRPALLRLVRKPPVKDRAVDDVRIGDGPADPRHRAVESVKGAGLQ